jgi:hypothetical protein
MQRHGDPFRQERRPQHADQEAAEPDGDQDQPGPADVRPHVLQGLSDLDGRPLGRRSGHEDGKLDLQDAEHPIPDLDVPRLDKKAFRPGVPLETAAASDFIEVFDQPVGRPRLSVPVIKNDVDEFIVRLVLDVPPERLLVP